MKSPTLGASHIMVDTPGHKGVLVVVEVVVEPTVALSEAVVQGLAGSGGGAASLTGLQGG